MKQHEKDRKYANSYHWEDFNPYIFSLQTCFDPALSTERCEDNAEVFSSLGDKRESENNQPELDPSKKRTTQPLPTSM
eukprot:11341996-Ditylum_brightwellii.AAC.1